MFPRLDSPSPTGIPSNKDRSAWRKRLFVWLLTKTILRIELARAMFPSFRRERESPGPRRGGSAFATLSLVVASFHEHPVSVSRVMDYQRVFLSELVKKRTLPGLWRIWKKARGTVRKRSCNISSPQASRASWQLVLPKLGMLQSYTASFKNLNTRILQVRKLKLEPFVLIVRISASSEEVLGYIQY